MEQTKVSNGEIWLMDGDSTAVVAPRRGGMVTLFNAAGKDVFYLDESTLEDDTKNVRGGIPLLFPSPGRLTEDVWAGGPLKQHGFARNHAFEVLDRAANRVALRLRASDAKELSYAYPFVLNVVYTLSDRNLRIDVSVENHGPQPMPMGFGLHPYFLVPQAQKANVRVPTRATRVFDNRAKQERAFTGLELDGEEVDMHLLDHGANEASLLSPDLVVAIKGSPEFAHWVVWTQSGKDYVCLEPWTCPADMLRTGDHLIAVPPGQSKHLWVEIRVSLCGNVAVGQVLSFLQLFRPLTLLSHG
jgi:galactose mutarotase-like enzyme